MAPPTMVQVEGSASQPSKLTPSKMRTHLGQGGTAGAAAATAGAPFSCAVSAWATGELSATFGPPPGSGLLLWPHAIAVRVPHVNRARPSARVIATPAFYQNRALII